MKSRQRRKHLIDETRNHLDAAGRGGPRGIAGRTPTGVQRVIALIFLAAFIAMPVAFLVYLLMR